MSANKAASRTRPALSLSLPLDFIATAVSTQDSSTYYIHTARSNLVDKLTEEDAVSYLIPERPVLTARREKAQTCQPFLELLLAQLRVVPPRRHGHWQQDDST